MNLKSAIINAFSEMAKEKNIDRDILESVIQDSFKKVMQKKYGLDSNFDIIVNMDKGNIEIFLYKKIVKEVTNNSLEIDIEIAEEQSGQKFEVGDDYVEEISIEEFGRKFVQLLKQNLNNKLREIEKEVIFNQFKDKVGEIISAEVYQIKPNEILLIQNKVEIHFPKSEQIPNERFKKGDAIRAIVKNIDKKSSGLCSILVSRTDDKFLLKLFEMEIPEVKDNIIEIKAIARDPGERAKIAVFSNNDRIDAVGACVGMRGHRIHNIVRELGNENIDVINYSDNPAILIKRSLAPAEIKNIYIDVDNKIAKITAEEDQISLIIGKNGQNVKLASKLTGFEIDVIRNAEEFEGKEEMELEKFEPEDNNEISE